jgi:hypothetical protein
MPFKSEKQRRFLHAKHPKLAEKWEHEGGKKRKRKTQKKKTRTR